MQEPLQFQVSNTPRDLLGRRGFQQRTGLLFGQRLQFERPIEPLALEFGALLFRRVKPVRQISVNIRQSARPSAVLDRIVALGLDAGEGCRRRLVGHPGHEDLPAVAEIVLDEGLGSEHRQKRSERDRPDVIAAFEFFTPVEIGAHGGFPAVISDDLTEMFAKEVEHFQGDAVEIFDQEGSRQHDDAFAVRVPQGKLENQGFRGVYGLGFCFHVCLLFS